MADKNEPKLEDLDPIFREAAQRKEAEKQQNWQKFLQDLDASGWTEEEKKIIINEAKSSGNEYPSVRYVKDKPSFSKTIEDLTQPAADLLSNLSPTEQEVAQAGAGAAAAYGYSKARAKLPGIAERVSGRVSEAATRPVGARPPMPSAGGLIPTDPQNVRIQTGTVGDEGTTGRARQTGYMERTAQEAARRAELARIEQELIARRVIPPGNVMAQMPGMTSTPGGILAPSSAVYPTQPPAPPAPPRAPLAQMAQTAGRTGANLLADLLRSRLMGALGAGSTAYQGIEALKQLREGNIEEGALSGVGALGGALSMIPTLPTAVVGGGLSIAPYIYRKLRQQRQMPQGQMSSVVAP